MMNVTMIASSVMIMLGLVACLISAYYEVSSLNKFEREIKAWRAGGPTPNAFDKRDWFLRGLTGLGLGLIFLGLLLTGQI